MAFNRQDPDLCAALTWIAKTPQGILFFRSLASVVDEIGPPDTCALHAHNERRKFASDLIAMAEADRRDGTDGEEAEQRNGPRIAPQRKKSRRHGPAGR